MAGSKPSATPNCPPTCSLDSVQSPLLLRVPCCVSCCQLLMAEGGQRMEGIHPLIQLRLQQLQQYSTVQYNAVQYSTVQNSTKQCSLSTAAVQVWAAYPSTHPAGTQQLQHRSTVQRRTVQSSAVQYMYWQHRLVLSASQRAKGSSGCPKDLSLTRTAVSQGRYEGRYRRGKESAASPRHKAPMSCRQHGRCDAADSTTTAVLTSSSNVMCALSHSQMRTYRC